MNHLRFLAATAALASAAVVSAQITDGLVGAWDFNGNLNASWSRASVTPFDPTLVPGGPAITAAGSPVLSYGTFAAPGTPGSEVLVFPEFTPGASGQWLSVPLSLARANGGGSYTNRWTAVMDVRFPNTNQWIALVQNNTTNSNDAEAYIRPSGSGGGAGISGDYAGTFSNNTWYRLAIRLAGVNQLDFFVNGALVNTVAIASGTDGRWSNFNAGQPGDLKLFADSGAFTGEGVINAFAYWDRDLTTVEIGSLGAPTVAGFTAIPEPSAFGALAAAAAALLALRRRRS